MERQKDSKLIWVIAIVVAVVLIVVMLKLIARQHPLGV